MVNTVYGPQSARSLEVLGGSRGPVDQYLPSSNYNQGISTPEYMIKMDDLLKSNVQNYEEATQLYYFDFDLSRFTNSNIADQQFSSGRVQISNPVFFISNGIHTPNLINRLISGILIQEIKITRLQNIDESNQAAEEITFTDCYFQSMVPKYDMLVGDFRFVQYMHKTTSYDQAGQPQCNNVVSYNMSTGEHRVEGG